MHVLGMKRTARTPEGRRIRVGRRWTASWRVDVRRRRIKRSDTADLADVATSGRGSSGADAPSGGGGGSGFGGGGRLPPQRCGGEGHRASLEAPGRLPESPGGALPLP